MRAWPFRSNRWSKVIDWEEFAASFRSCSGVWFGLLIVVYSKAKYRVGARWRKRRSGEQLSKVRSLLLEWWHSHENEGTYCYSYRQSAVEGPSLLGLATAEQSAPNLKQLAHLISNHSQTEIRAGRVYEARLMRNGLFPKGLHVQPQNIAAQKSNSLLDLIAQLDGENHLSTRSVPDLYIGVSWDETRPESINCSSSATT